ncbi:glutathione S-transferase family protein [Metapseudomonas lalkuanensis]|uniref:Glutathione S-transferase family protein n=1 Tax=Metapseudomonas lalkuanensis TaxID=2604832 RepID=A0A5J6QQA7_9GAMM|nr:glutathione S-transferase family protein [Pseudomonas lalkuanensis]QEY64547.1 glutathione S-transferase family protein [Pseudomonas lalkuanensis]UCO97098.1 glutathione S-transferase family protein [Pseudomonas lalkuanensis]
MTVQNRQVTLYHCPYTRSTGALTLLEELGADFKLHVMNMKLGEQRKPEFLAINPMGKVPTITHGDAVVTEQVSVYLYLADLYPEAKLAPPLDDPLRGPYLRWMVFYGSCFEPAVVDRVQNREPIPQARSPYGDFDSVMKTLVGQLKQGPWLLGEQFTAADVLWGSALNWTTQFGLIPEVPAIKAYIARFIERPAYKRALAKDAELAATQAAPT